tara:strand:- start:161 stop:424 length:264 start_codon:yes stop_codon:yes gene_type:complete
MAKYKITFKKSVTKDLRNLPNKDVKKILNKIDELAENPRGEGCIKLSGDDKYRVRQGLYRIIYAIRDDVLVVNVVKVGHRSSVYKSG